MAVTHCPALLRQDRRLDDRTALDRKDLHGLRVVEVSGSPAHRAAPARPRGHGRGAGRGRRRYLCPELPLCHSGKQLGLAASKGGGGVGRPVEAGTPPGRAHRQGTGDERCTNHVAPRSFRLAKISAPAASPTHTMRHSNNPFLMLAFPAGAGRW